jgi:hypothetical protein
MKARTLLLSLLLAAYVGAAVYQIHLILLARQRMVETAAASEKPTIDVVAPELKPEPVNSKPLAAQTGSLKKKHVVGDKAVERRVAQPASDRTRDAIKSFQETTELLTARLDPDVTSQLSLDPSEPSFDP